LANCSPRGHRGGRCRAPAQRYQPSAISLKKSSVDRNIARPGVDFPSRRRRACARTSPLSATRSRSDDDRMRHERGRHHANNVRARARRTASRTRRTPRRCSRKADN
jgi:hypothetical protein